MNFFFNPSQQSQESSTSKTPFFLREPQHNFSIFNSNFKEQTQRSSAWEMFNAPDKEVVPQKENSIIEKLSAFDDSDDEMLEMISKVKKITPNTFFDDAENTQNLTNEQIIQPVENTRFLPVQTSNQLPFNNKKVSQYPKNYLQSNFSFGHQNLSHFNMKNQAESRQNYKQLDSAPISSKNNPQIQSGIQDKKLFNFKTMGTSRPQTKNALTPQSQFQIKSIQQTDKDSLKPKFPELLKHKEIKKQQQKTNHQQRWKKLESNKKQTQDKHQILKAQKSLRESKVTPINTPSASPSRQQLKQKPKIHFQLNLRRSRATNNSLQTNHKSSFSQKIDDLRRSRVQRSEKTNLFGARKIEFNKSQKPEQKRMELEDRSDKSKISWHEERKSELIQNQAFNQIQKTIAKPVHNENQQLNKIIKLQENSLTSSKQNKNYFNLKKEIAPKSSNISLGSIRNQPNISKDIKSKSSKNDFSDQQSNKGHQWNQRVQKQSNSATSLESQPSSKGKRQSVGLKDQLKKLGGRLTQKLQIKSIAPVKPIQFKLNTQPKKRQTLFQGFNKKIAPKAKEEDHKKQPLFKKKQETNDQIIERPRLTLMQPKQVNFQQNIVHAKLPNVKSVSNFGKYMVQLMDLQRQFEILKIRSVNNRNAYREMAITNEEMNRKMDYYLSKAPIRQ